MPQRSPWRIFGGSGRWARRQIPNGATKPCSARWHHDHWLVEADPPEGAEARLQWVVLPDGRWEPVTSSEAEASVLERMLRDAAGVRVTIRPAALLCLAAGTATGALVHAIWLDPAPWAWEDPTVHDLSTAALRSLAVADWAAAWLWAIAVTCLVMLTIVVHELGHALAAMRVGHRWLSFNLGLHGAAVRCCPAPTGWNKITRSASGPAAQLAVCLPMLATLALEPRSDVWSQPNPDLLYTIWWVSGLLGALFALTNLVPIAGTDGAKIIEGIDALRESGASHQQQG